MENAQKNRRALLPNSVLTLDGSSRGGNSNSGKAKKGLGEHLEVVGRRSIERGKGKRKEKGGRGGRGCGW